MSDVHPSSFEVNLRSVYLPPFSLQASDLRTVLSPPSISDTSLLPRYDAFVTIVCGAREFMPGVRRLNAAAGGTVPSAVCFVRDRRIETIHKPRFEGEGGGDERC